MATAPKTPPPPKEEPKEEPKEYSQAVVEIPAGGNEPGVLPPSEVKGNVKPKEEKE